MVSSLILFVKLIFLFNLVIESKIIHPLISFFFANLIPIILIVISYFESFFGN